MPQRSKKNIDQGKTKITEVQKKWFEIQFAAKEKLITRLNDEIKDFNSRKEKLKGKTDRLNKKLKDDYGNLKKILDEKTNHGKQLKEEVAQLKQEFGSMEEKGLSKLKKQHDEFIREAGKYKSTTAIYAGRLNKLDEFSKQERKLEQKYTDIKEQNVITEKNYGIALKNLEEKKYKSEQIAQRKMVKRCVDLSLHMKKQSLAVECPVRGASTREVLDLKEMVEIGNKQNADREQKILNLKEENKLLNKTLKELSKSNKIIQKNIDDCSKKENDVTILESELTNAENLQGIQQQDEDTVTEMRVAPISLVTKVDSDDAKMQAVDRDLHLAQEKLRNTQYENDLLNRRIWKAQDLLLSVYEKASVPLEELKANTDGCKEKMNDFIRNLDEELKSTLTLKKENSKKPRET